MKSKLQNTVWNKSEPRLWLKLITSVRSKNKFQSTSGVIHRSAAAPRDAQTHVYSNGVQQWNTADRKFPGDNKTRGPHSQLGVASSQLSGAKSELLKFATSERTPWAGVGGGDRSNYGRLQRHRSRSSAISTLCSAAPRWRRAALLRFAASAGANCFSQLSNVQFREGGLGGGGVELRGAADIYGY